LVSELAPAIHHDASGASCECKSALEYALITSADARDPEMIKKLDAVAGRVLNT